MVKTKPKQKGKVKRKIVSQVKPKRKPKVAPKRKPIAEPIAEQVAEEIIEEIIEKIIEPEPEPEPESELVIAKPKNKARCQLKLSSKEISTIDKFLNGKQTVTCYDRLFKRTRSAIWKGKRPIHSTSKNFNRSNKTLIKFHVSGNFLHFTYDTLSEIEIIRKIVKRLKAANRNILFAYNHKLLDNWIERFEDLDEVLDFDFLKNGEKVDISQIPKNTIFSSIIINPNGFNTGRKIYSNRYYNFASKVLQKSNTKFKGKKYWDKIYISRRARDNNKTQCDRRRRLTNEDQVVKFYSARGYKEIWMEDYSFLEKISILSYAKQIALQGSATCLLLSIIRNKKITFLIGPYNLGVFPRNSKNGHKIRIIYGSYNKKLAKKVNIPWSINVKNLNKSW